MNKTIFNLFAALAFIFAALATPSAFAVKAVVGDSSLGTSALFEGSGNTATDALANAQQVCAQAILDNPTDFAAPFNIDCGHLEVVFWTVDDTARCFTASASNMNNPIVYTVHHVLYDDVIPVVNNSAAYTAARGEVDTICRTSGDEMVSSCADIYTITPLTVSYAASSLNQYPAYICDTEGVICEDDELPNQNDGSCGECPSTHEILNGICVEACTANQILVDRACMDCEANELADKQSSPQSCNACPTETTHVLVDIEGTETCRAREICESSELVDSELGTCEVCPDGYTANAAQDDCICSDNSLVTASGHCEPCTADNPLADKENNRCIRATEQITCQTYFLQTTPILNEFGECVAAATTADCSLVYPASAPLYNETTKQCEAPDCPAARPVYDEGNCRATIPEDCANGEIFQNSNCVARGDDDKVNNRAIVIGLIMVGAFVADSWSDERDSELNWTPSYAFNTNNGNVSYSVGSRWTAKTENFGYYWQTAKSGSGDIRYSSGIGYNNGIMQANIDSEGTREDTDIDLSISAQKTWGLWNIGGGYRIDTRLTPTESKTRNRLNLTAKYKIDQWILSATANTTGKKSTARINYSYRF